MSIIRRHRTVYNAAKILSLLCLVLLNSQKVGFALSYLDAIFEIGFNCLKTYFFFEMMTYLLVTPIILFFCMADTTFALKRSEESGA